MTEILLPAESGSEEPERKALQEQALQECERSMEEFAAELELYKPENANTVMDLPEALTQTLSQWQQMQEHYQDVLTGPLAQMQQKIDDAYLLGDLFGKAGFLAIAEHYYDLAAVIEANFD